MSLLIEKGLMRCPFTGDDVGSVELQAEMDVAHLLAQKIEPFSAEARSRILYFMLDRYPVTGWVWRREPLSSTNGG